MMMGIRNKLVRSLFYFYFIFLITGCINKSEAIKGFTYNNDKDYSKLNYASIKPGYIIPGDTVTLNLYGDGLYTLPEFILRYNTFRYKEIGGNWKSWQKKFYEEDTQRAYEKKLFDYECKNIQLVRDSIKVDWYRFISLKNNFHIDTFHQKIHNYSGPKPEKVNYVTTLRFIVNPNKSLVSEYLAIKFTSKYSKEPITLGFYVSSPEEIKKNKLFKKYPGFR